MNELPSENVVETKPTRSRRLLHAGALLASSAILAACGKAESSANPADLQEMENAFSLDLSSYQWEQTESFEVDGRKVTILTEKDAEADNFTQDKIEKEVDGSLRLEELGELPLRVSIPGDHLDITFTVIPALYKEHDYLVFEDEASPSRVLGQEIPAAVTMVNVEPGQGGASEALTMLASYPESTSGLRFGEGRLSVDQYNLAVETCNNLTDIEFSQETIDRLAQLAKTAGQTDTEGVRRVMLKLTKESVCNSYAMASATRESGYTYEEYAKLASTVTLDQKAGLGFTIPYIRYPKAYWDSL